MTKIIVGIEKDAYCCEQRFCSCRGQITVFKDFDALQRWVKINGYELKDYSDSRYGTIQMFSGHWMEYELADYIE